MGIIMAVLKRSDDVISSISSSPDSIDLVYGSSYEDPDLDIDPYDEDEDNHGDDISVQE
jgi:hypothetical protein